MLGYLDIGGTKTRVAVSSDGRSLGEHVTFATPPSYTEGCARIREAFVQLTGGAALDAIGAGIAGPLDASGRALARAPHLPDWVRKPLADDLAQEHRTEVFLENDGSLVALGEAHAGAGQGAPIMAYLTLSTGMGGARIVNGRIDQSAYGFEPGHQYIDFDRSVLPGCASADAEGLLSGTATELRFGKKPYEVADPAVWEELARWFAYALTNTIVHWSPHVVVLGGSMIVGDPAVPVDRIVAHLRTVCTIFPELPEVRRATLADLGGLHGALVYLNQRLGRA